MVTKRFDTTLLACWVSAFLLSGCAASGENIARERWKSAVPPAAPSEFARQPADLTAPADLSLSDAATLEELLAIAESRSPALRAAFDRWAAALEQVPQAKSLPDPKVSYAYFLESVETRVGPQRQKFGVSQTIPLFGKLGLRGEVAVHAANAAGAHFEMERRNIQYQVQRMWSEYYFLHRSIVVAEENVRLLQNLEAVALSRYTAGKAPHSAVIRAQVEMGKLEDRLSRLQDRRAPMLASLNAALNRHPRAAIDWPDTLSVPGDTRSDEELRRALLDQNPRLQKLEFLRERADAAKRLAGKRSLPDLTLGAEFIDIAEARASGVPESGKNAAIAKATVNIPLWFNRNGAEKAQAAAQLSATESEWTHARNSLLAEFESVRFDLRDAERRMDLYANTLLPKGRQSLEVTVDAFTSGKSDFLALIDAQRTLLDFELAYERAVADRATGRAELQKLVGSGRETPSLMEGVK